MTKDIVEITVSVRLDTSEEDPSTELAGLAHEALAALLRTFPGSSANSCGWQISRPRDNPRRRLRRVFRCPENYTEEQWATLSWEQQRELSRRHRAGRRPAQALPPEKTN